MRIEEKEFLLLNPQNRQRIAENFRNIHRIKQFIVGS